jgi:hypothetical protein
LSDVVEGQGKRRPSQIARNLKGGVCEKEYGQTHVVLVGRHIKIFLETLDLGIANVSAFSNISI